MEFFLPSLLIVILALGLVFAVFPRMGPMMLAVLATVALIFAVQQHMSIFKQDYATMTWTTSAKVAAPYVLVGVVVLFSIGYILYLWGAGKRSVLPTPPMTIPPPSSATNMLTTAIGNSLKATGLATVSAATANTRSATPSAATLNTAAKESIASKIA
jgi:hypothetical protein